MSAAALVIAEPEPATRGFLERHLEDDGFDVLAGADVTGLVAHFSASGGRPDLVLLGDATALERWDPGVPVIVLGAATDDATDRVRAFRRGCDDYVDRPFHYDELLERIRAVLRRTATPGGPDVVEAGPIRIDLRTRAVTLNGARVVLAQKEYELLLELAREPERVFTKEELLRTVWDYRSHGRTRTLDSHASRLRRKLRAVDFGAELVVNVWGVGYRLLEA
jgi:DNA-binding response OmpR family regulator